MNHCEQTRAQMAFYLDDELQTNERAALEAHLNGCAACRHFCEHERRFLESVRATRTQRVAPPELRARVEHLMSDAPAPHTAPAALRLRIERSLWPIHLNPNKPKQIRRWLSVTAIILMVLLIGFVAISEYRKHRPHNQPSAFALMAVNTHLRHLRDQLPLEIVSDAPEKISAWFAGKVEFKVELPNYQESSGQEKLYDLEGGRLVGYQNDYAAYVAYRMQQRPISLLVTSEQTVEPSGGEEIVSKNITFHYDSINGFKVITWSDRGLTYALVSDLEERGQHSCIVCHQGTKDQDFISGLKP